MKEDEYFDRLIYLVYDLGTEVLLKIFEKEIKPQTVEGFLKSKLTDLERKSQLYKKQKQILRETPPDVSRFDISLLCILISYLKLGCGKAHQLSSVIRIRNKAVSYGSKNKMNKSDFERTLKETENCLVDLAAEISQTEKESVAAKIKKFKTDQLDEDQQCKLNAKIKPTLEEDRVMWKQQVGHNICCLPD